MYTLVCIDKTVYFSFYVCDRVCMCTYASVPVYRTERESLFSLSLSVCVCVCMILCPVFSLSLCVCVCVCVCVLSFILFSLSLCVCVWLCVCVCERIWVCGSARASLKNVCGSFGGRMGVFHHK